MRFTLQIQKTVCFLSDNDPSNLNLIKSRKKFHAFKNKNKKFFFIASSCTTNGGIASISSVRLICIILLLRKKKMLRNLFRETIVSKCNICSINKETKQKQNKLGNGFDFASLRTLNHRSVFFRPYVFEQRWGVHRIYTPLQVN